MQMNVKTYAVMQMSVKIMFVYKKLIWKSAVLMELSFLQYLAQEYTKIIHMSRL